MDLAQPFCNIQNTRWQTSLLFLFLLTAGNDKNFVGQAIVYPPVAGVFANANDGGSGIRAGVSIVSRKMV
jgi:hypothetical protein